MAILSNEDLKRQKKRKRRVYGAVIVLFVILSPLWVEAMNGTFIGLFQDMGEFKYDFNYIENLALLLSERIRIYLFGIAMLLFVCFCIWTSSITPRIRSTETVEVAPGIKIPSPAGNGEYGNSWFLTTKEFNQLFQMVEYDGSGKIKKLSPDAGLIVRYEKIGNKERIWYMTSPTHAIILGATRIGKTRRLLLTSTWLDILAGVNLCILDVKGEIYAYTSEFAREHKYRILTYDLRNPEKSDHHNYMIEIVQLLKEGNVSDAVDKTWDLVSVLVGEAKGEKIWNDGECSTIAAVILIVAQDAPEGCKNLTNVYYFLAYMCESSENGDMPINDYLQNLPANHPARAAFQVAKIAPFRTRSSFFTSALGTLRLFTDYKMAEMSSKSDYLIREFDQQKTIIYMIVPDEKKTKYPLVSLYINQVYMTLTDVASQKGGSLDRKFIFRGDEVGNFPYIPCLGGGLSAGAGRKIFFELVIQDHQQMKKIYKEEYGNIKSNAQLTMCLRTTDEETLKELRGRCGPYTIQVNNTSMSQDERGLKNMNISSGTSLTGRPLLYEKDIEKIKPPGVLIFMGGEDIATTQLPDISVYYANKELGLGDEAYNKKVFLERHAARESREVREPNTWNIWEQYSVENPEESEKVSFL